MEVKPLEDRILIRPLEADDKTESGIFLPESAKEKPMRGTVVAMGPGRLLDNGERVSPSVKSGMSWSTASMQGRKWRSRTRTT